MLRLLFLLPLMFILSCRPSSEELAKIQKAREDSIKIAVANDFKARLEIKTELEKNLLDFESQYGGTQNRLQMFKGELEVQKDRLDRIKEFHLMRTPEEREAQIRAQVILLDSIKNEIPKVEAILLSLDNKISSTKAQLLEYQDLKTQ
ncbi:MAG: hypothetical protein ACM3MI_08495 [Clostridiales bacterium]